MATTKTKKSTSKGMNKSEFVTFISEQGKISKSEAEKALNMVTGSMITALKKGKGINLVGFGTLGIQQRDAREGRNPKTGEKMKIKAYKQPVFKAGKAMKDACNGR